MQCWEWGEFKKMNGRVHVERFIIQKNARGDWKGVFAVEFHSLYLGTSYVYSPRGPVLEKHIWKNENEVEKIFHAIKTHLGIAYPKILFIRLEPSYKKRFAFYSTRPFLLPREYIQPRLNQVVDITPKNEDIMAAFSRDMRHDLRAAEKRGLTFSHKTSLTPGEIEAFHAMKHDTTVRSGKTIYPSQHYFDNLDSIFSKKDASTGASASVGGSTGASVSTSAYTLYHIVSVHDEPVALYITIYFGTTATYLYGGSYSGKKAKRAPAYLHWVTMLYARGKGYHYYDLGAVDEKLWPGLTYFKKQFGGATTEYVGNIDIILRPYLYVAYTLGKKLSKIIRRQH